MEALLASGPFGIVCAVLLWRDFKQVERDVEREKTRIAIEEKRAEGDKALAVALALISERVK